MHFEMHLKAKYNALFLRFSKSSLTASIVKDEYEKSVTYELFLNFAAPLLPSIHIKGHGKFRLIVSIINNLYEKLSIIKFYKKEIMICLRIITPISFLI